MESREISDQQISASTEFSASHAAIYGRLNFKYDPPPNPQWKSGGWSARVNDGNQWLQIELDSPYTRVTRVATQGRNAHPQWIIKYKLQYSNDGVNFHYYKEQEQAASKVKEP